MAYTTPKTWSAAVLTSAELNEQLRDNMLFLKAFHSLDAADAIEIASGAFTIDAGSNILLDGESSADDDLDTISGGTEGLIIYIMADGVVITLKDGTGNLVLGYDVTLQSGEFIALIYDGTNWKPLFPLPRTAMVSGVLTEDGQHGEMAAWQNTTGHSVAAYAWVNVTTGSTAAAKINVGQAATEIESDNIIDGASIQSTGLRNNIKHAGSNGLGVVIVADDEYITFFEDNSADPADFVGNYYIFYTIL